MLLTLKQVAQILNIHVKTVEYHLKLNRFETAQKIGRDWLFESYEILELREQRLNTKNKYKTAPKLPKKFKKP